MELPHRHSYFNRKSEAFLENNSYEFKHVSTLFVLMEFIHNLSRLTIRFFVIISLPAFVIEKSGSEVFDSVIFSRFIGCSTVTLFGALCDSYTGRFYPSLVLQILVLALPCLYLAMCTRALLIMEDVKIVLFYISLGFHVVEYIVEPLRFTYVTVVALERIGNMKPLILFSCFVTVKGLSAGISGVAVYYTSVSRTLSIELMLACLVLKMIYLAFFIYLKTSSSSEVRMYSVVEKTTACAVWYLFKNFRRCLLRHRGLQVVKTTSCLCFEFSETTVYYARCLLGIGLVFLPLSLHFMMQIFLKNIYFTQFMMLKTHSAEIPMVAWHGFGVFVLLPIFHLVLYPCFARIHKNETSRQLTLIGIGACIITLALMWTAMLQRMVLQPIELWRSDRTTHVAIVSVVKDIVYVREEYLNHLRMHPEGSWFALHPCIPLVIMHVPPEKDSFKMTVFRKELGFYDDYNFVPNARSFNWYILHQSGITKIVDEYFYSRTPILNFNPQLLSAAKVSVFCELQLCEGTLVFTNLDHVDNNKVHKIHMQKQKSQLVTMVGKYKISYNLYGKDIKSVMPVTTEFGRLGSYMVVLLEINEKQLARAQNGIKEEWMNSDFAIDRKLARAPRLNPLKLEYSENFTHYDAYSIPMVISIIETKRARSRSMLWMLPTVILYVLGEVFSEVCILTFLYEKTPAPLRTTIFCFKEFLSIPAYIFMTMIRSPAWLQEVNAIAIFTYGCISCLFMIIYFFAATYYTQRFMRHSHLTFHAGRSNPSSISEPNVQHDEDDNFNRKQI